MGAVWLKTRTDLKTRRLSAAVSLLVIAVVAALVTVAISTTFQSMTLYSNLFAELNGADIWLQLSRKGIEMVEKGQLPDEEVTEKTAVYRAEMAHFVKGDIDTEVLFTAFPSEMPPIGKLKIVVGAYLSDANPYGAVVDRGLAEKAGLGLGDRFTVHTSYGDKELVVRGLEVDAMHMPFPNWRPNFVFVTERALQEIARPEGAPLGILGLKVKEPERSTEILTRIRKSLPGDALTLFGGYDRAFMAEITRMINVVPVLFIVAFTVFAVIAAWIIIGNVVGSTVMAQTQEIGILKAVGFTPGQVRWAFVLQNMLFALVAGVAGVVAGAMLAPYAATRQAQIMGIAEDTPLQPGLLIAVVLVVEGIVFLATILPAWRGSRLNTVQSITFGAEVPKVRGNSLVGRLAQWGMPIPLALGVKDSVARPVRTLVTVSGLGFAVSAATFALILNGTIGAVANDPSMFGIYHDISFSVEQMPVEEAEKLISKIPELDTYYGMVWGGQLSVEGSDETFFLRAAGGPMKQMPLKIQEGREVQGPDEIVVGKGLLNRLGLKVGDTLHTRVKGKKAAFTIVGRFFTTNNMGREAVVSIATLQRFVPDAKPDTFGVKLKAGADADAVVQRLEEEVQDKAKVAVTDTPVPEEATQLQSLMLWLSGALGAIALISLFNTFFLSVLERRRELGVLKSVGMTPRQIAATVTSNGLFLGLVACVIGVPVGVAVTKLLLAGLAQILGAGDITTVTPWGKLALLLPLTLATTALTGLIPAMKAARTSTVEVLRTE